MSMFNNSRKEEPREIPPQTYANASTVIAKGVKVEGDFNSEGDVVIVRDETGTEIARGVTNYSAADLRLIRGHKSDEFAKLLGRAGFDEVIHRDHLHVVRD